MAQAQEEDAAAGKPQQEQHERKLQETVKRMKQRST
jgi:hypothetical protein